MLLMLAFVLALFGFAGSASLLAIATGRFWWFLIFFFWFIIQNA